MSEQDTSLPDFSVDWGLPDPGYINPEESDDSLEPLMSAFEGSSSDEAIRSINESMSQEDLERLLEEENALPPMFPEQEDTGEYSDFQWEVTNEADDALPELDFEEFRALSLADSVNSVDSEAEDPFGELPNFEDEELIIEEIAENKPVRAPEVPQTTESDFALVDEVPAPIPTIQKKKFEAVNRRTNLLLILAVVAALVIATVVLFAIGVIPTSILPGFLQNLTQADQTPAVVTPMRRG